MTGPTGAVVLALGAPPIVYMLFAVGFSLMDQREPAAGAAGNFYTAAVAVGILALAAAIPLVQRSGAIVLGGGLGSAVLTAFWFAALVEVSYGPDGGAGLKHLAFILLWCLVAGLTVLHAFHGRSAGTADAVLAVGVSLAVGLAGAAGYHLVTLEHQEALARQAWRTPGPALLLILAAVAAAAAFERRRRRT